MTTMKNRERILEAIDQLRRRKARPDVQRICNYLFRRFAVNSVEAKSDLDWCVANNYVLKVEYKGSMSYRNAAKRNAQMKQRDPNQKAKQLLNHKNQGVNANDNVNKLNRQFSELLTNAFGELIVEEPDYLEIGVPGTEIINSILSKDSVRYTKKYVSILLEKEVKSGGLIKMDNGHYLMGPSRDEEDRVTEEKEKRDSWESAKTETEIIVPNEVKGDRNSANHNNRNGNEEYLIQVKSKKRTGSETKKENFDHMDSSTNSADEKKSDNGSLRIGGRRKRAKKVFDPSDNNVPKKRGRPIGSLNRSTIEKQLAKASDESRPDSRTSSNGREQGGVCSVCHTQNKRGPNDRMVACRECSNKAHFSCLNGEDMMLKMYPDNTWQCPHCKTCVVCYETSDAGNLTVCSVCADGYHVGCHQPRISEKNRNGNKWLCINCQMPDELKINQIQSSIENSYSQKSLIDTNDATSNSGDSSSFHYTSPPLSPTPPQLSPQTGTRPGTPDEEEQSDSQSIKDEDEVDDNIDPSIPDATHWTADEVYQYFVQYFPEEAKIFKEQEIDGRSLLLLTRMDVLTNLNLKLGPALKIYKHVVKLQVRRDDPKLYWL